MTGPAPNLHLPFADWPAPDRELWQWAFAGDDPFDGGVGSCGDQKQPRLAELFVPSQTNAKFPRAEDHEIVDH